MEASTSHNLMGLHGLLQGELYLYIYTYATVHMYNRDSSVGVETVYGQLPEELDSIPGRGKENFHNVQTYSGVHPATSKMFTGDSSPWR
jgi:hypothetical protein